MYCKKNSEIFARFYFRETSQICEFPRKQNPREKARSLSFNDIGKSCREYLTSQIYLFTLFAKIKFSRKFPNLQYAALTYRMTRSLTSYSGTNWSACYTVKPVLSGNSKRRPKLFFKIAYRLMQVKSIAECSERTFCNTFDLHLATICL